MSPIPAGTLAYVVSVGREIDGLLVTVVQNDGDRHSVVAEWLEDLGASSLTLPRANLRPITPDAPVANDITREVEVERKLRAALVDYIRSERAT